MSLPDFSMRQLLEAGVHFGHQTHRWNPKMEPFIFGARNGIHILDLAQTVPLLHQALVTVRDVVAGGGRLLFVGTKRAAAEPIADAANRSAQYFMNHRWLGGTLTNWQTISNSIKRMKKLQDTLSEDNQLFTKKELLGLTRERDKLEQALGGIQDMSGLPDLMFVIDTNKEAIAIKEARKLGIPVVAVLDSNCDPEGIDYPIPGNDDAGRAVTLYCDLIARAAIEGISESQVTQGVDVGESEEPVAETAHLEDETTGAAEASTEIGASVEIGSASDEASTPEPVAETVHPEGDEKADVAEALAETGDASDEASTFKGLDEPDGEVDDLKQITGIGPAMEKKLHDIGIYHYRQIAALTTTEIFAINETLNSKGRIERDGWLEQAEKLAKG